MKAKLDFTGHWCTVKREPSDPHMKNHSHFMYWVRKTLLAQGYKVVKKLMEKDGHMVDRYEYYVRTRRFLYAEWGATREEFALRDPRFVFFDDARDHFNREGKAGLELLW